MLSLMYAIISRLIDECRVCGSWEAVDSKTGSHVLLFECVCACMLVSVCVCVCLGGKFSSL